MTNRGPDSGALIHHLGRLFERGTSVGLTEGELLERFVGGHDESAFETLVARHGPMVLGVCRQLLQDPNDVDDAFQATFLVLVRKAGMLRRSDLLGNWLYGVAYRVAARARTSAARRAARLARVPGAVQALAADGDGQGSSVGHAVKWDPDPWPGLHQEISHLPEKYRVPIVLCYFEGLTHDEAASRLGWPLGSVKGRLARARDLLRRRLSRRGMMFSPAAIVAHLSAPDVRVAVPSFLEGAASRVAQSVICHAGTSLAFGSAVSIPVTALVEGVLQTIMINQVRSLSFSLLCAAGIVTTGVVLAASQRPDGPGGLAAASVAPQSGAVAEAAATDTSDVEEQTQKTASTSPKPASAEVLEQLRTERAAFDNLLSHLRDPALDDIDRLNRWSLLTLQADLVLANTDDDQTAVYQAHRDRIKRLYDRVAALPVSPQNQPVKANQAHDLLEQADTLLESRHSGPGNMGGMMSNMGMGMMGMSGKMAGQSGMNQMANMQSQMRGMMGGGGSPGFRPVTSSQPQRKKGISNRHTADTKVANAPAESDTTDVATPGTGGAGMMSGMMRGGGTGAPGGMMGGRMMGSPAAAADKVALHSAVAASVAEMAIRDPNPRNKVIFKKLEEPISMSFNAETPLEDLLKYIRQATTTKTYSGIPIYVDPQGISDADVTMSSTICNMDLEGIPLKTTLRLLLRQQGLAYCVRDGVLIISSYQGILDELSQARTALEMEETFGGGTKDAGEGAPAKAGAGSLEPVPPKAPTSNSDAVPAESGPGNSEPVPPKPPSGNSE
jgi:DNA-directed RNA polymerase specialized sigma24 family protein